MFKKVSIEQLAIRNIRRVKKIANPTVGDLITIIAPWKLGDNYQGIVVKVSEEHMTVYHGYLNKKLIWPLNVKCDVIKT